MQSETLNSDNQNHTSESISLLDAVLFQQIADGNKDAFHRLYLETYKSIYAYLLSIVQNKEEAEDLLQETYIRVRLHASQYKDQGKPLAWMFTIARNLALMRLRELKKSSYQDFDDLKLAMNFNAIKNMEDRMVLKAAFQVLDEEERGIVLMHAVSGAKHREIASILNKPLATILSKYRRAIKKLQKELEKNGKE